MGEDDIKTSGADWTFDGDKKKWKRVLAKITAALQDNGGPSLVRHWHGDMCYLQMLRTIVDLAPYTGLLDEEDTTESDANWTAIEDIPRAWREFCDVYVPGKVDIADPLKAKGLKLVHYQRYFVKQLALGRDLAVYNYILKRSMGKAALILKQIPKGAGDRIQAAWTKEFGKIDKAEEREMKAAFADGDPFRKGSVSLMLDDRTDIEAWFRKMEDLRVELAEIMDDKEAKDGLDTKSGGILSYANMSETILTVFNAHTTVYDVVLDGFEEDEEYETVRDKLKNKYRTLQRKRDASKEKQKSTTAATKAQKAAVIAQITMQNDHLCFKCGGEGHYAADPSCPKFFENFPDAKGGKGKGGWGKGKGKGEGKGKGGGKGKGKDGGGKGKGGGKGGGGGWNPPAGVCFRFAKNGECRFSKQKTEMKQSEDCD